jgi:hypothetical protein
VTAGEGGEKPDSKYSTSLKKTFGDLGISAFGTVERQKNYIFFK